MEDLRRSWGERVAKAREAHGFSQRSLAKVVGASQSVISQIERGIVSPSDSMRMNLATALSTNVEDLFPYPKGTSK